MYDRYPSCPVCGHRVIWQSDFDFEDYGIYDEKGIVHNFSYTNCGADIECYVPENANNKEEQSK